MNYIVLEIQTYEDGNTATLSFSYNNRNEAESKYHTVLAAAAISAVPVHAAVLLTNEGQMVEHKYYKHAAEQE